MEIQKSSNSQCNPEQRHQYWRYHNSRFQIALQSQRNRQKEQQNRLEDPEIMQLQPPDSQQSHQKHTL
jgi:hypothetical protein